MNEMKPDRKPSYADLWIVAAMITAEGTILAIISIQRQTPQTQGRWDTLFWVTSVGFPVVMVVIETMVNLAKRPRPFLWRSIAASVIFLFLCGAVNAMLTCHVIKV